MKWTFALNTSYLFGFCIALWVNSVVGTLNQTPYEMGTAARISLFIIIVAAIGHVQTLSITFGGEK